jgi:hypothetical protein
MANESTSRWWALLSITAVVLLLALVVYLNK